MAQPTIEGVGHGIPRMIYGSDGTDWYAIQVDSDGHVKIDVVTSALPTDAAKETKQNTMITALQLIDDLRNALGSVNTDDLQVDVKTYPGSNALGNIPFGYYDRYAEMNEATTADGTKAVNTTAVPAGEVWVVTNVNVRHNDPTARMLYIYLIDGTENPRIASKPGMAQYEGLDRQGFFVLKQGDYIQGQAVSLATGMKVFVEVAGYKMKVA